MANQFFQGKGSGMQRPGGGGRGNALGADAGLASLATKTPRLRLGKKQTPKLTNKISTKLSASI